MTPATDGTRAASPLRWVAVAAACLIAAAIAGFVLILSLWPHPPAAPSVSKAQAQRRLDREAHLYADALALAARSGPLSTEGLRAHPVPHGSTVGAAEVSTRGDRTLVTFPQSAPYGPPDHTARLTVCVQVVLAPSPQGLVPGGVSEVAASRCAPAPRPAQTST